MLNNSPDTYELTVYMLLYIDTISFLSPNLPPSTQKGRNIKSKHNMHAYILNYICLLGMHM